MKSNFLPFVMAGVLVVSGSSCGGNSSQKPQEQKTEQAAVVAGQVSKSLLTAELKQETEQLLKDMPDSDLPYKVATKQVEISVANLKYMLPVAKANELNTQSQKARALGIYFADRKVLEFMGKPTAEVDAVMSKLVTDLNISFVADIVKRTAPANADEKQLNEFLSTQEDDIINAMMTNDKCDVLIELLGAMTAEYACVYSNPGLVVKGDATGPGLTDNMVKRVQILKEITTDLSTYYPTMKELGDLIAPLDEMTTTVNIARSNNAKIEEIRAALLK